MAKKNEVVKMDFMQKVKNFLESEGETVLQIKSGTYSIPWALDGDEGYLNLTFSVPKGTRDGDLFDGYEEAEIIALRVKPRQKPRQNERKRSRRKWRKTALHEKRQSRRSPNEKPQITSNRKGGEKSSPFFKRKIRRISSNKFLLDK